MKKIAIATLAAVVLSVPAVSFAQQANGDVTRAQVRSELVALEQAGYAPGSDYNTYPSDLQAAQRSVVAANMSYGSAAAGHSNAGVRAAAPIPEQTPFFGQ